jgi:flagellar hook-basal body complex protein FliE
MSLFSAIQGMGTGYESLYANQLQDKLKPQEILKVQGADSFSEKLANSAVAAVKRPTFAEMVERGVHNVDAKQKYAGNQVRMLMTGESDNLHQAMIAMEESGVAFNLMMETRNQLMSSYQELMRLRV